MNFKTIIYLCCTFYFSFFFSISSLTNKFNLIALEFDPKKHKCTKKIIYNQIEKNIHDFSFLLNYVCYMLSGLGPLVIMEHGSNLFEVPYCLICNIYLFLKLTGSPWYQSPSFQFTCCFLLYHVIVRKSERVHGSWFL